MRSLIAGLALAGLVLTSCSDDAKSDGDDDPEPADGTSTSAGLDTEGFPGGTLCPASVAEVEAATGWIVDDVSINGGGSAGTDLNVAWTGCTYETDDDGEIQAAQLVDDTGEPSRVGYDAGLAVAVPAAEDLGPIGEGSVFGSGSNVWVSTGDATLYVHLINFDVEPSREDLFAIASAIVDGGYGGDCATLRDALPSDVVPQGAETAGSISDASTTYATCRIPVDVGGQEFDLEVRHVEGTEVFDAQVEYETESGTDDPTLVDGVGDSAFQDGTRLFFAVDDQAFVVSAEDADGTPVSADVRVALAESVLAHADELAAAAEEERATPTETAASPTDDFEASGEFCDNLRAMFDSLDVWEEAFGDDDYDALVAWARSFQPIGDALYDTVPPEQADDLDLALSSIVDLADAIAPLDGTQKKAIDRAFRKAFADTSDEADAAGDRVVESCGIDPDTLD